MVGSGDAGQKKDLSELPRPFSNSWAPASSSPHCPGTNHCLELVLYRDSPTFAVGQTPAQQGAQDRGSETVLVLAQLTPR